MLWLGIALAGICTPSSSEAPLGAPPDRWPAYPGRCLDVGPPTETLVERARRCVREEPEDPAPLRILRWMGDERDVPVFRAFARGRYARIAVEGLQRVGGEGTVALLELAQSAPSEAVIRALAAEPHFEEEELYVAAAEQGLPAGAEALGTLGTDTAWAVLDALPESSAVLLGRAHLADWSDRGLDRARMWMNEPGNLSRWSGDIPRDHPLRRELLLDAVWDPDALLGALGRLRRDDDVGYVLVAVGLQSDDDEVRMKAAELVARHPDLYPFEDEVTSPGDPIRAVGYHAALARMGHEPSRAWLWEQLAGSEAQWPAVYELLRLEEMPVRVELSAWAAKEGTKKVRPLAESTLQIAGGEVELPAMRAPRLSRRRVPTADAEALRAEARAVLDGGDEDRRVWALDVLPWVGGDDDVPRILSAARWPVYPKTPLSDLGSPAALEALADIGAGPGTWAWTRTPEGWSRLLDGARHATDFAGVLRPESARAARLVAEATHEAQMADRRRRPRRRSQPVDLATRSAADCRARLVRGDWLERASAKTYVRPAEPARVPPAPRTDPLPLVTQGIRWVHVTAAGVVWVASTEGLFRLEGTELQHVVTWRPSAFAGGGGVHMVGSDEGMAFVTPEGELVERSVGVTHANAVGDGRVVVVTSNVDVVYNAYGEHVPEPVPEVPPLRREVSVPSPDGRWRFDGQDVVEQATGEVVGTMPGWSSSWLWSPDGRRLYGSRTREPGVWVLDPEARQVWSLDLPRVTLRAWSPDGKKLWATYGHALDAYDPKTGASLSDDVAHRVMARVLYVSQDGRTVVSGDYYFGRTILWRRDHDPVALETVDLPQPAEEWVDHEHDPRVPHSASASRDGGTVAVLFNGGDLAVFDGRTGALRWREKADVHVLDDPVRKDALPSRRQLVDHLGPERLGGGVAVDPSGRVVAAVGRGPEGEVLSVWRDGERVSQVVFGPTGITIEGFDRDERLIVRGGRGLFAVSTRRARAEELEADAGWVWFDDGRVHVTKSGDPPPDRSPPSPIPATLEQGRVVFWERPVPP